MSTMIAKFRVTKVEAFGEPTTTQQQVTMMAVTDAPFDPNGLSDDNSFARYTPSGELKMTITNPNLLGALKEGEKYYLNFTKAAAALILLCVLCGSTLSAQTTNPPPVTDPGSWFAVVQNWALTQNTNNSWAANKGSLSAGVVTLQNSKVSLANELRLAYEVAGGLAVEAGFRDSGVAGTMVSAQLGLGYHFKLVDLQLIPFLSGGYDRVNADRFFGEAGIRAEKKMTKWTFVGVSYARRFPADGSAVTAYTGFAW